MTHSLSAPFHADAPVCLLFKSSGEAGNANRMMVKRKRNDESENRLPKRHAHAAPDPQTAAEGYINGGLKELTRALKQAKGFERQRLGKRLKESLKSDDAPASERINAEIAALKTLESRADLAQQHLFKVLLRTKSIKESPQLPPFVRLPPKRDDDAATANVTSRLFRSKAVKKAVDDTLEEVRQALDLTPGPAQFGAKALQQGKRVPVPHKDGRSVAIAGSDACDTEGELNNGVRELNSSNDVSESDGEWAGFDDRIVASPDETDEDEDAARPSQITKKRPLVYVPSASQSPSPEPSLNSSAPPSMTPSPEPRASKASTLRTRPDAFLPSLSMGGYLSNSDSEAEDLDALGPPRKNRRGQRARQQIWEKKYGGKAKHLHTDSKDRNSGWDARRGAKLAGEKRRPGQAWKKERPAGIASGSNEIAVKPRKKAKQNAEEKPLHPSWQAKKMAKEKQTQGGAFVGKKTTFD